jgi:MFS family permease
MPAERPAKSPTPVLFVLLLALGGAVCALAGSIGVLIGGRVIQGVAARAAEASA